MQYVIRQGENIRALTGRLGCSPEQLKQANPKAVGRTRGGQLYLIAGATIDLPKVAAGSGQRTADDPRERTLAVKAGESLVDVSRRTGISLSRLKTLEPKAVSQNAEGQYYFNAPVRMAAFPDFPRFLAEASGLPEQQPPGPKEASGEFKSAGIESAPLFYERIVNEKNVSLTDHVNASRRDGKSSRTLVDKSPDDRPQTGREDLLNIKARLSNDMDLALGWKADRPLVPNNKTATDPTSLPSKFYLGFEIKQ